MQLRRQDVLNGAIAILDEYGLGDLTMRRLASSLGVQPGALYWHFPHKQALLAAITDTMLAGVAAPLPAAETATGIRWDERLRTLAHRMRDGLLAHRDGAEVATASYAARLMADEPRTALAEACREAGLPESAAQMAADTLLYYILGQTMDEQSRMQMDSYGALDDEASPMFDSHSAGARFDFGLNLFVDGVAARLHADGAHA
ncbi:MAG: TetR/AcrR family transcriptional regulator C-terminal domain-containing protein [Tomitella sp.]|nr:TetR/AcrR family transcriptional regulator C-terminal domain-containing protein [Tomitella sp.]